MGDVSGQVLAVSVSVAVAVAADPRRAERAERLAAEVGGHVVWDTKRSEWDTHARAWRWCHAQGADWGVVLQDDAVPVPGFRDVIGGILWAAPVWSCVGLYVGTSRPPQVQPLFRRLMAEADARHDQWIRADSLYWGVGVAMPRGDILPALRHPSFLIPYDERVGAFFRAARRPVLYTWPSLVDHADEPTLLVHADGQPRTERRRAWRVGVPGEGA